MHDFLVEICVIRGFHINNSIFILHAIKIEDYFIKHFFFLEKRKPVLKEKIIHTSCDKNRKFINIDK